MLRLLSHVAKALLGFPLCCWYVPPPLLANGPLGHSSRHTGVARARREARRRKRQR